jgi:leucyl aminopeptidase
MDFSIKTFDTKNTITTAKVGCIAVGVFEHKKMSAAAKALDHTGCITAALKSGDISGKSGTSLMLRAVEGVAAERILLVGLGADEAIKEKDFSSAVESIAKTFATLGASEGIIALPADEVTNRDVAWAIHTYVTAFHNEAYRSDSLKSKKEPSQGGIKKFKLAVPSADATVAKQALTNSIAIAHGVNLTRDLGNMPGNFCTPTHLANTAKKLATDFTLDVEVLERKQIEALKMGSFLSVSNGSDEPPKFIVLKHMGGKAKDAPIVLVGKGITFDSGGISLKPGAGMDEMKYDMCGAGSVLGTFRAIAELGLKLNVIGVIASCENMPNGRATKPGDIVTSMAGLTIEVLNTDAEGRLILCDALTYVERFNPAAVIDIATLTGACVVSLGHHKTGLFTRHDEAHDQLANELLDAGKAMGDTAWRMPVEDVYDEQLKSNFADIANIGTPGGGSIVAACFLERFTKKYTWAHLDIAGTGWKSGAAKGATGRPVSLLTNFLINRAQK